MRLIHPQDASRFAARNALLQTALRPEPLPFPIAAEYPIVLSHDGNVFSYCLEDAGRVVAHANLWPRLAVGPAVTNGIPVGLVGNVATDPERRGQGVMTQLFNELIREATAQGLQALLLWSDLSQFYQKLGFRSCGIERRYLYDARTLLERHPATGYSPVSPDALGASELAALMALRPAVPLTLARTPSEMRRLLAIPATALLIKTDKNGRLVGYMIVGKGYDMAGVVHEWGGPLDAPTLLSGLASVAAFTEYSQVMLLAAESVTAPIHTDLARNALSATTHVMALMRPLSASTSPALESLFVWGLDSI